MATEHCTKITNKKEIAKILAAVSCEHSLVHLSGGPSKEILTSTLLEVDGQSELLYLDCSNHNDLNNNLLEDTIIGCRTTQSGIRLEFDGIFDEIIKFKGGQAFVSELPCILLKFQRRDYFRVPLGLRDNALCKLFGETNLTGKVVNISLGGIAAEFSANSPLAQATLNSVCGKGVVDIPGLRSFNVDLIARFSEPSRLDRSKVKLGFEFASLPADLGATLQKYITKQEQADLLARRGNK
jgi:c-di-GMP-binding flagellar brake protein YcgR